MSKLVETVVEILRDVDPKQSYFVELDDTRLVLKRFDRGRGPFTSMLRATGVPFGKYEVVGTTVVHRYDPETVLRELTRYQQLTRMKTPAFLAAVKRVAKRVGGRVYELERDIGEPVGWIGYTITPKRTAKFDVAKLAKDLVPEAAVLFATDTDYETDRICELGVLCGDTIVDALTLWYGEDLRPMLSLIDEHCGIELIESMRNRVVRLRLARTPTKVAPVIRALVTAMTHGEGQLTAQEWKQSLAERRLMLWWDY